MSTSTPVVFNFVSNTLRVVMRDGNPWFVAADVCAALGISRTDDGVSRLDDDEKGAGSIRTPGGDQQMTVINESGLYSLILGSRKPEAKKFKKWVASEVLPAIRKTGRYIAPTAEPTDPVERYVDLTTHPDIRYLVQQLEMRFWFGGSASHAAWASLRKIGGARATAFPESQVPRALEEIRRIVTRADTFFQIKCNFEEAAIKWVFGTDAEIINRPELPPMGEQLRLQ